MKKYGEYLQETLADEIASEPKSQASAQARKMGLTYAGFGRYLDAQGIVAYVVQNGQLVPFKGMSDVQNMYTKAQSATNPEKQAEMQAQADAQSKVYQNVQKRDSKIMAGKANTIAMNNDQLNQIGAALNDDQIATIQNYMTGSYESVNRYLYKGFDDGMDPMSSQDITNTIAMLDSAFDQASAPFPYSVYTSLSARYSPDKMLQGSQYLFRGYLSTSLDPVIALSGLEGQAESRVLLQIDLQQGQRALHIDGFATQPGDMETLLPRGSVLQIMSGPHQMDASVLDGSQGIVNLFHCAVVDE